MTYLNNYKSLKTRLNERQHFMIDKVIAGNPIAVVAVILLATTIVATPILPQQQSANGARQLDNVRGNDRSYH